MSKARVRLRNRPRATLDDDLSESGPYREAWSPGGL